MLRFLTAGESHGQALVMTIDGMPAGLEIDIDALNAQLGRRQRGYGRGRRMQIESDRAELLAGVRHGVTTGAPIALLIRNRDWVNWQQTMYVEREMPAEARARNARTSRARVPGTPTLREPSNTATTTSATSWNGPAPGRRLLASPPAALPASSWLCSTFASPVTCQPSAMSSFPLDGSSRSTRPDRCQTIRRCGASIPTCSNG